MAKKETHIKDCKHLLGEGYEDIHEWLDFYAKKYKPFIHLEYHRKFRHNRKTLEKKFKEWNKNQQTAAKIHIVRDCELYVLKKPFKDVRIDEIDGLYEIAIKYYCHF